MKQSWSLSAAAAVLLLASGLAHAQVVSGERKQWHKVTVTFDGPSTNEGATPNPFTDYRLNVTFSHAASGTSVVVPGYYAADGDAADTSATGGNKWRVHFTPDRTGTWSFSASFRAGTNIAMSADASAGSATSFNGQGGSFAVSASDKTGRDHRGKGMLRYAGEHYLRFAGSGEWFLKVGPDSPEGFLANPDFDGSTTGTRASFNSHLQHWTSGDPTWGGGKGKKVIGAVNYISGKGMNVFYLMTYSGHGDTDSVWPYRNVDDRFRFDCSKLDQWEVAFEHMDRMGMLVHLVLSETENEAYWEVKDNESPFGRSRKLYYRELIARFAHHPALVWNLGEENGWNDGSTSAYKAANSTAQRKAFCDFIRGLDPYDHPIVVHNLPGMDDAIYGPLLGFTHFEGTSMQLSYDNFSMRNTNAAITEWIDKSDGAGRKWIVSVDEPGHEDFPRNGDTAGVRPDALDAGHDVPRKYSLWGAFMAGAAGHETYFGWAYSPYGGGDGEVSNYAAWDKWWNQCRIAHDFFTKQLPLTRMKHDNGLTDSGTDYVLAERGETYAVYLRDGGSTSLDLTGVSGTFEVKWYDPRSGGALQNGSVATVSGGAKRSLGAAPNNSSKDWAVLVRRSGTAPAPVLAVTGFTLYDADADQPISSLASGAVLNLATLPTRNLSVRAVTNPATVGSVRFGYDGNASYHIESEGPYLIAGGSGTSVDPWTPSVGSHSLSATPYSGANATGTAGTGLTVTFTVVDQPAASGPAVTSLTLMNADTDQPVSGYNPIAANATLNLATLPTRRLNIRANVSGSPGSVRFAYDADADYRIESGAPYAFAGDDSGDYVAWTPSTGAHTIQAVPYTGSGATGAAGTSLTVHLSVVDNLTSNTSTVEDPVDEPEVSTSEKGDGSTGGGGGGGCGLTGLELLLVPALLRVLRRRR